jgi:hypothetical protein
MKHGIFMLGELHHVMQAEAFFGLAENGLTQVNNPLHKADSQSLCGCLRP